MRATILIGCFKKSDANDPEIYFSAVVAVLTKYNPDVVGAVTEPTTGLPAKLKWLPSIAEIVEACEDEAASVQSRQPPKALPAPRYRRPSEAELDAQFARHGLSHLRPGAKFVPPKFEETPF